MNKTDGDFQSNLKQIYSFSLLLIGAIVIYCQQAWVPGFFKDGYLYGALGKNALEKGHWWLSFLSEKNYPVFNLHPPLTFIMEGIFFKFFGVSWTSARLFGCLFAIACIVMVFLSLKRKQLTSWGFFAGTILVLMPPLFENSRFPNTDLPLTFFILLGVLSYFRAYSEYSSEYSAKTAIPWVLTGVCFGLALLCKGPPAFILPLTILLHLSLMKKLAILKSPIPWLSLLLGLAIFSIWPFILWKMNIFHEFIDYLDDQFMGTVIKGRGNNNWSLFIYPGYLLKKAGPWFILSLIGTYQLLKNSNRHLQENALGVLFVCLYLSVLIPFSLVRWKYSHYILPCYPGLAVAAAYPLSRLSTSFHRIYSNLFKFLIVIVSLLLLVFPITTSARRDKEILTVLEMLKHLPEKPNEWLLINEVYPFYSLVNLIAWQGYGEAYNSDLLELSNHIELEVGNEKKWIVLLKKEDVMSLERRFPEKFPKKFSKFIYFSNLNMMVLISSSLLKEKEFGQSLFHFPTPTPSS